MSDSTRRHLNEVIAKDIKDRERSIKDRFDKVLVTKLINACETGAGETEASKARALSTEEAICVIRRFLTLTHGMDLNKIDTLFESLKLSTSKVKEMSA